MPRFLSAALTVTVLFFANLYSSALAYGGRLGVGGDTRLVRK